MGADGSNPTALTDNSYFDDQPNWGTPAYSGKITSDTTLISSRNPAYAGATPYPGQEVTLLAMVGAVPPGDITPTGTVQFKAGDLNLGSPVTVNPSNWQASYITTALPEGTHNITAVYSGDDNYYPCVSNTVVQVLLAPKPDLIVSEMSVFQEGNYDQYRVSYTIRNTGTAPALWGYDVSLYADGVLKETRRMDTGIPPGSTSMTAFANAITVSGFSDEVMVVVDTNERNAEIDETNNSRVITYYKPPASYVSGVIAYASDKTTTIDQGPFALDREIFIAPASGGDDIIQLTDNEDDDFRPVISPDGSKVLFTSNRSGSNRLYSVNITGGEATCLTPDDPLTAEDDGDYSYGVWSPGSDKIAYLFGHAGAINVYIMNTDGTGRAALTNNASPFAAEWPTFNEDGNKVIFTAQAGDYQQLFAVYSDAREARYR
jgi:hypothetical protein